MIYIQCSLKTAGGKRLQVFLSKSKKNVCTVIAGSKFIANIYIYTLHVKEI